MMIVVVEVKGDHDFYGDMTMNSLTLMVITAIVFMIIIIIIYILQY